MIKYFRTGLVLLLLVPAYSLRASPGPGLQYAALKNKAELCILDTNYTGALHYYRAAFACHAAAQRDLYNAFITAYYCGDSAMAKAYYNEMVALGQTAQRLSTLRFGRLHRKEPLYRWLERDYEALHTRALGSPAAAYAAVMDSVFDADQAVRVNYQHLSPEEIKVMIARDSVNITFLKNLIASHGFPGYRQTGLFDRATEGWVHGNSAIFFLLWHSRNLSTQLDTEMIAAVHAGDLPPEDYALIMDSRTHENRYGSRPPGYNMQDEVTFDLLPDTAEAAIDRHRAGLGLCNLADYRRKLVFQHGGSVFYFFSGMHMALALSFLPIQ